MALVSLGSIRTVLCLGAHADDIDIGCGGTVLRLLDEHGDLDVHFVIFSADGERAREARNSAEQFLARAASKRIETLRFKDGYFPSQSGAIKDYFEEMKPGIDPDVIFTHYRDDLHQDHRVINELTWNTFRRHLILEYEIPKWDGDLGVPNLFVPLTEQQCRAKTRCVIDNFPSQAGREWFREDVLLALMRLRGMESKSPSTYAEAFYARKIIL
jgi:LmbE family N-acetylglucosaminyl deacetylase